MKDERNKQPVVFKRFGIVTVMLALVIAVGILANGLNASASSPTVKAPNASIEDEENQDNEAIGEKDDEKEEPSDPVKEADENKALAAKATITETDANKATLDANKGATIVSTSLEDENGSVIYEVKIKTADGKEADVKVDATTGTILTSDNENENENED